MTYKPVLVQMAIYRHAVYNERKGVSVNDNVTERLGSLLPVPAEHGNTPAGHKGDCVQQASWADAGLSAVPGTQHGPVGHVQPDVAGLPGEQ